MKKVLIIIVTLFLITGCTKVKDLSYDSIAQTFANIPGKSNIYRTGYKYYLPRGMKIEKSTLSNETISDDKNTYYLYVDMVSYYNKVKENYVSNKNAIYSKDLQYDNKYGYIEINLIENDKYLVEIMYNYAKIEVIVDKDYCNESMLSAINILKSIEYNDNIIANILGDDILNFSEEKYDIFKIHGRESNFIQAIDEVEELPEETVPDTDLIN